MRPYTIEDIKQRITPVAEKYGLAAVYLFGSYARGEASAESDIDLLVDLKGSIIRGLNYVSLYNDLETVLETSIDLVTVDSLDQPTEFRSDRYLRENINRERKMIYAVA